MDFVSRKTWGALEPGPTQKLSLPASHLLFEYTETRQCTSRAECCQAMRFLQKKAMDSGLPDIPYNFLFGGDDDVYEGRGWNSQVRGNKLILAYIGREDDEDDDLDPMIQKSISFLKKAMDQNLVANVVPAVIDKNMSTPPCPHQNPLEYFKSKQNV